MRGGDRASSLPQEGWPVASQGPQPPCHRAHETGPTLRGTGSTRRGGRLREGKLAAPAAGRGLGVLGDGVQELCMGPQQPQARGRGHQLCPACCGHQGPGRAPRVVVRPLGPWPDEGRPRIAPRRGGGHPSVAGAGHEGPLAPPRGRAWRPCDARQALAQRGGMLTGPRAPGGGGAAGGRGFGPAAGGAAAPPQGLEVLLGGAQAPC
mmetsp:Transcript_50185/g.160648  ORF Transcript_50185/g.160648 Transcript_50185/m.160648 type:complete len:207 (+) Transcript_50185:519-1139(+)